MRIGREIGGTDAQMPEVKQTHEQSTNTPVNAQYEPAEPHLVPVPRKIRKSGTGCIYQINDHLWEGSFYPRLPNGKRKKFNVYAETREQCEAKLAEMIAEKKAEIADEKAKRGRRLTNFRNIFQALLTFYMNYDRIHVELNLEEV